MARIITLTLAFVCFFALTNGEPIGRVIGGVAAEKGRFPYQITLRRPLGHTCGGSILSPSIIATAAHCVDGQDANTLTVRAGSIDRFQGGVLRKVAKYIKHENYTRSTILNDVAIIFLDKPLIFSKNIQPIRLPASPLVDAASVILSGWGRIKFEGDIPRYLQQVTLSTLPKDDCMRLYRMPGVLCIRHDANLGVCNGDSGGPAAWNNELVGIASFVYGKCGSVNPDGYTEVYQFVDWIKKNAGL